jgi:hypothetical protein
MLKRHRSPVLVLLTAVLLPGCGDDSVTGLSLRDLAGQWTASSFTFTSVANPSHRIDLIGDMGGTMTLSILANGSFSGTINLPGVTPFSLPIGGTVTLDAAANTMDVSFDELTLSYGLFNDFVAAFTLDEARRILTWSFGPTPFDFPQNPAVGEEAAMALVILTRT